MKDVLVQDRMGMEKDQNIHLAILFCQAQRDIFDEEFDRVDAGSLAIMLC